MTVSINIVSSGSKALGHALALVWPNAAGGLATHYRVVPVERRLRYYARRATGKQPGNVELTDPPMSLHVQHSNDEVPAGSGNGTETLILLWHEENGSSLPLPYPLNMEQAIQFVEGWLGRAAYGREPDHDGDNGKGWRAFNNGWGHVAWHHYGIVGIQPVWMMYPK